MKSMIFKLITVGEKRGIKHEYKFNNTGKWFRKRNNP